MPDREMHNHNAGKTSFSAAARQRILTAGSSRCFMRIGYGATAARGSVRIGSGRGDRTTYLAKERLL